MIGPGMGVGTVCGDAQRAGHEIEQNFVETPVVLLGLLGRGRLGFKALIEGVLGMVERLFHIRLRRRRVVVAPRAQEVANVGHPYRVCFKF
jgi:hypothetical protein